MLDPCPPTLTRPTDAALSAFVYSYHLASHIAQGAMQNTNIAGAKVTSMPNDALLNKISSLLKNPLSCVSLELSFKG